MLNIDWLNYKNLTVRDFNRVDRLLKAGTPLDEKEEQLAITSIYNSFDKEAKKEKVLTSVLLRLLHSKELNETGIIRRYMALDSLINPKVYPGSYLVAILPKAYKFMLKDKRCDAKFLNYMAEIGIEESCMPLYFSHPKLDDRHLATMLNSKNLSQELFDLCLIDNKAKMLSHSNPTDLYLQRLLESDSLSDTEKLGYIQPILGSDQLGRTLLKTNLDLVGSQIILSLAVYHKDNKSRLKLLRCKACPLVLIHYYAQHSENKYVKKQAIQISKEVRNKVGN